VDDKYRELWAVLLALGLGELLQFSVHVLLELSQGVSVQISCADYADLPRYSLKRGPGIIDFVLENNSQSPGPTRWVQGSAYDNQNPLTEENLGGSAAHRRHVRFIVGLMTLGYSRPLGSDDFGAQLF
jgi:hypothetical protein